MKTVLDVIEARRSVKNYDPDAVMSDADFSALIKAALQSPTSYNTQNWRFVRVTDKQLRKELRVAAKDQAQVTDASELIVLCADLKAWSKKPERYWADAPEAVSKMLVPMIRKFYEGREQVQRDEAMRSCGIAAQTLMLAAKSLGYDSCPMIGFDPEKVAELIKLPADHVIGLMVAIGKATAPARPRGGQLPLSEVLKENHF
jgi:nitroreductase